jgi:hypothetical protein
VKLCAATSNTTGLATLLYTAQLEGQRKLQRRKTLTCNCNCNQLNAAGNIEQRYKPTTTAAARACCVASSRGRVAWPRTWQHLPNLYEHARPACSVQHDASPAPSDLHCPSLPHRLPAAHQCQTIQNNHSNHPTQPNRWVAPSRCGTTHGWLIGGARKAACHLPASLLPLPRPLCAGRSCILGAPLGHHCDAWRCHASSAQLGTARHSTAQHSTTAQHQHTVLINIAVQRSCVVKQHDTRRSTGSSPVQGSWQVDWHQQQQRCLAQGHSNASCTQDCWQHTHGTNR